MILKELISNKVFLVKLSMDLSDTVELTVGARWYDIEVDFEGSANSSFWKWIW